MTRGPSAEPGRVAVLSDIHGVLPALEAVLAEPDVAAAERIVLTGDIAAGPQPGEVIELLRAQGDRVLWVAGNADRELVGIRRGGRTVSRHDHPVRGAPTDCRPDRFPRLPAPVPDPHRPRPRQGPLLPRHAPRRRGERPGRLPPGPLGGGVHRPGRRRPHGGVRPYGRPGAHWCLLGPGTDLRVTPYDIPAAAARLVAECAYPDLAAWADHYLNARASDVDALEAFGPRDGRTRVSEQGEGLSRS